MGHRDRALAGQGHVSPRHLTYGRRRERARPPRDRRPRALDLADAHAPALRGVGPGAVRPRDGAGLRPHVGCGSATSRTSRARRLHHREHRRPAGPRHPPGRRVGPGLPQQLPPPRRRRWPIEPAGHCGRTLTCPYHNWSYAIDGRLIGIPDEPRMYPDGFPKEDYGLVPIRVEVAWDMLVFGCLSHRAPAVPASGSRRSPTATTATAFETFRRFHRAARPDLPHQLEGVRRELERRLPRAFRAPAVQRRAATTSTRSCASRAGPAAATSPTARRRRSVGRSHRPDRTSSCAATTPTSSTPTSRRCRTRPQLILVRADPLAPDRTRLFSRIYGRTDDVDEQEVQLDSLATTNAEDTDDGRPS